MKKSMTRNMKKEHSLSQSLYNDYVADGKEKDV